MVVQSCCLSCCSLYHLFGISTAELMLTRCFLVPFVVKTPEYEQFPQYSTWPVSGHATATCTEINHQMLYLHDLMDSSAATWLADWIIAISSTKMTTWSTCKLCSLGLSCWSTSNFMVMNAIYWYLKKKHLTRKIPVLFFAVYLWASSSPGVLQWLLKSFSFFSFFTRLESFLLYPLYMISGESPARCTVSTVSLFSFTYRVWWSLSLDSER